MNFIVSSSSMAAVNTFYGFPGISRTYINFPVLEKCQKKFQDPYEPCRSIHCMSGCSSVLRYANSTLHKVANKIPFIAFLEYYFLPPLLGFSLDLNCHSVVKQGEPCKFQTKFDRSRQRLQHHYENYYCLHLSARIFPLSSSRVMVDKVNPSISFHSFLYKQIYEIKLWESLKINFTNLIIINES